jgi:hypothetical protein
VVERGVPSASGSPSRQATFLETSAKALAGGYAVVAAALTTIGTLQGGLGRLLLNRPLWSLISIACSLLGIAVAFAAAYAFPDDDRPSWVRFRTHALRNHTWKLITLVVGAVLFVAGLLSLASAENYTLAQNERPAIAVKASFTGGNSTLEGTVSSSGVKSSEWIYVAVRGAREDVGDKGRVTLYQTRAGPDSNGKVEVTFTINVARVFDFIRIGATRASSNDDEVVDPCFPSGADSEDQSCATLYPPHGPKRPSLGAAWEKDSAGGNLLSTTVKTSGIDPDDVVLLDVSDARSGEIFYRSMFSGSPAGTVDASAKVSIPRATKTACVVGRTLSTSDLTARTQPPTRTCTIGSFDLSSSSFLLTRAPSR